LLLPGRSQSTSADPNQLFIQLAQSKPDSNRVGLFIQLAEYYYKKMRLTNRMDSVASYLKKAQQLNDNFHSVRHQNQINFLSAKRYLSLHPDENAKNIFFPVIDTCKKTGDKLIEGQAWTELALKTYGDNESLPFLLSCHQKAVELASKVHDNYTEIRARGLIALVHTILLKFELAETELLQLLKEEDKVSAANMMYIYDELAYLYISKNQYDKALRYALRSQTMMGAGGDSSYAGTLFTRLSEIYRNLEKMDECIAWATKALEYNMATNASGIYKNIDFIAYQLSLQGKPREALDFLLQQLQKQNLTDINDKRKIQETLGDTYDDLKMYEPAEKSYLEMIRLGNEQGQALRVSEKGYDNCNMGSFYFRRGKYNKALPYLDLALKSYEAWGQLPYIKVAHIWLFKTDSALGNYVSAIKHLKQYNRLGDSIFNVARNKQIEELQVAYKTEQNAKDFRLLQGKEKLGQVQLQNTKNTRNWIIAGASLLLIIAGLLYRLASLRKKNNSTIKNKNELLQHLVTEKEWLLKEVHHRVKNNLHTVIGLLESQAAYLQDDALKANEISKHRIYAMSLIHQQLYNAEDIKTIDMQVYLPELLDYLNESFGTVRKIRFRLNVAPLKLGVSQAIPVGLIVNEAVTNSIKYAFLPGKQGNISINMQQKTDRISLVIADDGIGIDPAITSAKSTSMGLKLMNGLTGDIGGEIYFINENGTRIEISFHPDPLNEISTLSKYN